MLQVQVVGDEAVADALDASQASTTGIIDRMEERGLVARERGAPDRRVVNVTLTEGETVTTIPKTGNEGACPVGEPAWYYDIPDAPTKIHLCENACDTVSAAGDGAELNVVAGCTDTIVVQ